MNTSKITSCLFGLIAVPCALARTATASGALHVLVKDTQGQALAGAQVRYRRVVQSVRVGTKFILEPGETWVESQAMADGGGAIELANLPIGDYLLCATVPSAAYLDPCVWRQAVRATVSANATASQTLSLEKGVFLRVRVNDPKHLLPQAVDGPWTPRKLLVGVTYANGAYQGALNTSSDAAGRDYLLIIPAASPFKLWLSSTDIALADPQNNTVSTSGAQNAFQATAGQDQVFSFTVTGPAKSQ